MRSVTHGPGFKCDNVKPKMPLAKETLEYTGEFTLKQTGALNTTRTLKGSYSLGFVGLKLIDAELAV